MKRLPDAISSQRHGEEHLNAKGAKEDAKVAKKNRTSNDTKVHIGVSRRSSIGDARRFDWGRVSTPG